MADQKPAGASNGTASYRAEVPQGTPPQDARKREPLRKVAVFVAHGMGQQIPFETLDQVAEGLRRQQREVGASKADDPNVNLSKPVSRSVKFKDQWFQRVELRLTAKGALPADVHVYEGYWAPLTEGKVTLRDVISFLTGAARNGILNASTGTFQRWLFERYEKFPIASRTLLYLLVALATVGALVAMNSTIVAVAAGRALLGSTPPWLSDGLFADLTTTFNAVITAMAVFAVSFAIAVVLRTAKASPWLRRVWSTAMIGTLVITLSTIILAGLSLPLLFHSHIRGGVARDDQLWRKLFEPASVDGFNATVGLWAWWLAIAAVIGGGAWWTFVVARGMVRDIRGHTEEKPRERLRRALHSLAIAGVFVLLVSAAVWLILKITGATGDEGFASVRGGVAWVLLVVASVYIRRLFVQFVGDVAVYIMPYKVDAFAALRSEIKQRVFKAAQGIYEMTRQQDGVSGQAEAKPEYDDVIMVGHSLGSVIVYDVLNNLILEDEANKKSLNVVKRTPMLLTFGCPLDKTAFIFGQQGKSTTEAREALAASVQPLIINYDYRPTRWVNVYSPWDIISGGLDFYDLPKTDEPKKVENNADPDAATLLAAHTEYWKSDLVFRWIYAAIAGKKELFPNYKPAGDGVLPVEGKTSGELPVGR